MAAKRRTRRILVRPEERASPSQWRLQHGDVEQAAEQPDAEAHRHRAVDTLGQMLNNGTITPEMHDAGFHFRDLFRMAQLDSIGASSLVRTAGVTTPGPADHHVTARITYRMVPMSLPWMAARIVLRPAADLRPHAGNARVHNAAQLEQIKASMLAFGFTNPLLVDEHDVLIAGHGRLEAALALGIPEMPVIVLKHLSPAQKDALRLADNRIAENATWDQALLRDALAGLQQAGEVDLLAIGFSQEEIGAILAAADEAVTDGDAPDEAESIDADGQVVTEASGEDVEEDDPADATPEPPRQAVARVGDVWCLGDHRLACGDSADPTIVTRLMRGERAAMLFTSPPYGNQRDYTTGGVADWDVLMQGVFTHLGVALAPDAQVLVNLGMIHRDSEWQPYWNGWLDWMRGQGWRRFGLYVWDQGPGLPGDWNGRFAPSFEFVFHFNRQARQPNKFIPCRWAGHVNGSHGGLRNKDGTVTDWQHAGQGVQETRKGKQSWLVDHRILVGNPFEKAVWQELRQLLGETWRHASGQRIGLSMTAIDSGDGMTTAEVYAFVRSAGTTRVIAVKGQDALRQAVGLASKTEIRRNGTRLGGLKVWPVGSSYLKGETYGWLKLDRPTLESGDPYPEGYVHLPVNAAGEEYCRQLTAEQLVVRTDRRGFRKMEWVKMRERNEALDCRVYARAATAAMGMDGWSEGRWDRMADAMVAPASPVPSPADEQLPTTSPAAFVNGAAQRFGRLDILVNNAGIRKYEKIDEASAASWNEILNVNLLSYAFCAKAAVPLMRQARGGAIVNVASVRSVIAGGGNLQYDTTKAAIAGLTRALAADHSAEGIRVNAVGPGPIFTPFHQRRLDASGVSVEQYNASAAQTTMLKRPGKAEEVAAAILFLASDDASYVTGTLLFVDGGMTAL